VLTAPKAEFEGLFEISEPAWDKSGTELLPVVYWRQNLGDAQVGLGWQVHERRATLALAWRGWQVQAGADRFGAAARSRDLGLAWQTPL
jgi:hypothetical protein